MSSRQVAVEVLVEAWERYRRHLGTIVGLSLVGSAQRALVQFAGDDLSPLTSFALEGLTWGTRALLVLLLFRWTLTADPRLRGVGSADGVRRVGRYLRRYPRAVVVQLVGFAGAFAVLDLVPDLVVAPLVPPAAGPTYWAVLLAVKNPTVIAFTVVWEFAVLHQALVRGAAHPAGTPTTTSSAG